MNHKILSIVLRSALFLAALGAGKGATYYVSTTGSDGNSGSQSAPFLTISKGVASATNPGDTVLVMNGTYGNNGVVEPNFVVTLQHSGTAGNPITIMAQNRGQAILDSGNTSTTTTCNGAAAYFNLYNASFVVIQGFVIQNACDSGIQSNDSAHDITIRWNEIRYIANREVTDQIGRDGIYLNNNEYNFTFDGNIFHDIGRTSGQTLMQFDHGIYTHAQNLTVINNVFYNMTRGWSIQLADGAANMLIANNTFSGGDADGGTGQIMFWAGNTNITLENNIFYQPTGAALTQFAATISGSTFSSNIIYGVSTIMNGSTAGFAVGANQIGVNPSFVNAAATPPNFGLQSGSPAIAAGITLAAVVADQTGATRATPPDVGAYQYAAPAGPSITGVFTSGISSNSAFVSWATNTASTSYVQYGPSGYTASTAPNASMVMQHSVALSGLAASTLYHFRAASQDSSGNLGVSSDFTFTTAAPPVIPTTFGLAPSQPAVVVTAGQSVTATINASLLTGNAASVTFSASGQPAGTVSFSSSSCTVTCSVTATITPSSSATAGAYTVTVTGTGAGTSASATVGVTVTAPVIVAAPDPTTGLMARWILNSASGTTALDSSGNGNNGTVTNGRWWAKTTRPSLILDGSDSYVTVNESATLEMTSQLTVSFWVDAATNSNADPRVIDKLYDWDVKLNGTNRNPQFEIAGGQYAMLNYSLPLNAWHHIAFTFANGIVTGYVDGVATPFAQNTITPGGLAQFAYGLYLGTDPGVADSYVGALSDVRVYDRALSAADIGAVYSGCMTSCTVPVRNAKTRF